jgi:hypothetical protein
MAAAASLPLLGTAGQGGVFGGENFEGDARHRNQFRAGAIYKFKLLQWAILRSGSAL